MVWRAGESQSSELALTHPAKDSRAHACAFPKLHGQIAAAAHVVEVTIPCPGIGSALWRRAADASLS